MRKFCLTLDDFSPRKGTNDLYWCNKLIEKYPDIKINLFTTAAYGRLGEKPYYLSENLEWVEWAKKLPKNYRINLHGLFHRRIDGKHPNSHNDEFQYLDRSMAKSIIDAMLKEFDIVGLKYHRTFRAPGWKVSKSAVEELIKRKILIAGNKEYYDKYKSQIKYLHKHWKSYNWDLTGKCEIGGDILSFGHVSNWTNNYMNEERYKLIKSVLDKENFDFKFVEEM